MARCVVLPVKCHVGWVLWSAVLLGLIGCGGGGGAGGDGGRPGDPALTLQHWVRGGCSIGAAPGTIAYRSNWPGSAPAAASQVIQIVNPSGAVIRTEAFNRGGAASSAAEIRNIPAGVYEFRATLYSAVNGTGTVLGSLRRVVDLCQFSSVQVNGSGSVAASLQNFPAAARITTLETLRVVPQAAAADGVPAFAPAGITYSSTGPVAVNAVGVASPTGPGAASVTAQSPAPAPGREGPLTSTTQLTVDSNTPRRGKWTVLVYLNAANDLYAASDLNMNQMERVAGNPDVRFVVQWKQTQSIFPGSSFNGVRRYLVTPDATPQVVSQIVQNNLLNNAGNPLDMGSAQTLKDFIQWGKTNYPADRYVLVLWNHGAGWKRSPHDQSPTRAFSYDDQYGTAIQTWQIDDALVGQNFDIIAWDCSLMQMMEVAVELAPFAKYIAGSEESPPSDGYPYDAVFQGFRDNPDAATSLLSRGFVDGMLNNPPYATRKITQSVIDTAKLAPITAALDALAAQLIASQTAVEPAVIAARNSAQSYSPTSTRWFRDIVDLCLKLEARPEPPASVKQASALVRQRVAEAMVWEGNNANSPNSHGLSIEFSPGSVFSGYGADYRRLRLAAETQWDEYLGMSPE